MPTTVKGPSYATKSFTDRARSCLWLVRCNRIRRLASCAQSFSAVDRVRAGQPIARELAEILSGIRANYCGVVGAGCSLCG
jgi:hypothetical protein